MPNKRTVKFANFTKRNIARKVSAASVPSASNGLKRMKDSVFDKFGESINRSISINEIFYAKDFETT